MMTKARIDCSETDGLLEMGHAALVVMLRGWIQALDTKMNLISRLLAIC